MNAHRSTFRLCVALALAAACVALPACSGSDNTTNTGPVARFTPDTAAPPAGSVALLPGSSTGAAVNVRVTVTGVSGFFGTAFRIKYDPTALLFSGWDNSNSFLRKDVADADVFFLEDHLTTAGEIVITATRLNPDAVSPVDVTPTSDLVVLTFVARKALASGAVEGRVDFADPKQVCDGTVAAPGCGAIAVTWSGGGVSAH